MMRVIRRLAGACLVLVLAACTSAPTRFYTLMSPSAPAHDAGKAPAADYRIDVLPVTVPAQDDRPQLVVRQGRDRVALLEGDQWIAPLSDQLRGALSAALSHRLGAVDVHGLPENGADTVYRINLDVRRFESVLGRHARIDATWSVHPRGGDVPPLRCRSSFTEPVDAGIGALVRGHQQALVALSGRIASVVQVMAEGGHASCP